VKRFDKTLHASHDWAAKNAVIEWLEADDWEVVENPDIYGVDLIAERENQRLLVEVEIKRGWTGSFPFKSLHIPKRKEKFIAPGVVFMVLDFTLTQAYVVTAETLQRCSLIEKNTSLTREPDQFFEVPLTWAFLYDIEKPSQRRG
jgi:hypothetical protein